MSFRQNIPGRRPDGMDMGRSDGQLGDKIFQKFYGEIFPV
jgi:hypothetical protein